MLAATLGFLFLFSIGLPCSAEESLGDPFAETSLSAEDVFKSFMSRSKFRSASSGYNVTAVAQNVKQGTEFVSQLQDAFDKVQAVGKSMGEIGAELFKKNDDVLKAGKVIGKAFSSIGKYLGPALGGAGAAFAIVAIFVGQGKSDELEAIEQGFKEMHQRFDQISTQIKDLDNKVDFYETIREYNKIGVIVRDLKPIYAGVLEYPKSSARWEAFNDTCKAREADKALKTLHEMIVRPDLHQGLKPLVNSVVRYYKLDYPVIMSWFERMSQYAYVLASVKSSCYGARFGKQDPAYGPDLATAEKQVKEIIQTLAQFEEKFTDIEEEYVEFVKEDVENAMKAGSVTSADENRVNSLCDNYETKFAGVIAGSCRGSKEVNTRRVAVQARLGTKYFWLNWAVVVYQGTRTNFQCTERQAGQRWYHAQDSSSQGVVVSWTRKDADMNQVRIQALNTIGGAMQEGKGKSMNDRTEGVKQKALAWIKNGPLGGKGGYCALGGWFYNYHRSVTTSGVMAHGRTIEKRPQINGFSMNSLPYYNDFIVVFG